MQKLLAEMVDCYNITHSDYLRSDSISETELLLQKIKNIEKDILDYGVCINLSINEWEAFILKTPDIVSLGELGKKIIRDSLHFIKEKSHYNLLDKIIALEDEILLRHGSHSLKKEFYENLQLMQQVDEKTAIKNVIFREYLFIKDQAINLMKENINAI